MSPDHHGQAVSLDLILGPHLAAAVIRRTATVLQHDDLLPEHTTGTCLLVVLSRVQARL
ncbi:hypothetical protein ACFQ0M_00365 [Kitasatospora aburaviensis]|uniref:Uncharacterized protein n=1 Tax=Kitasatospora aburaviensis TaxID=67265 RepID=A0ABW1F476_9ACTN